MHNRIHCAPRSSTKPPQNTAAAEEELDRNTSMIIKDNKLIVNINSKSSFILKYFFPIIKKLKSIKSEEETKLLDDWKQLLANGNEEIKNESDEIG